MIAMTNKPPPALGANLKAARKARGMTQSDLASATGLHQGQISEIERGARQHPSAINLQKVADALGVTVGDLLHGTAADPANIHPTLTEFLENQGDVRNITPAERAALASARTFGGEPTVWTWGYILDAMRSTKK